MNDAAALAEKVARKAVVKDQDEEEAARRAASQTKVERKNNKPEDISAGIDALLIAGSSGVKKK